MQKYNRKQDSFEPHDLIRGQSQTVYDLYTDSGASLSECSVSSGRKDSDLYMMTSLDPPESPKSFLFITTSYRENEKPSCNRQTSQLSMRDRPMGVFHNAPALFHYTLTSLKTCFHTVFSLFGCQDNIFVV